MVRQVIIYKQLKFNKMNYEFTISKFPAKANDVGKYFEKLHEEYGEISPEIIVEKARDENNLLHNYFEWDDTKAAHKYRLEQAKEIIRCLVIQTDSGNKTRAIVSVQFNNKETRSYQPLKAAMNNDYARAMLLEQAKRDAQIFIAKYKTLIEKSSVISEMEKVLKLEFVELS
jgi:hypothetical protein